MKRKKLQMTFWITSGRDNYDLCEAIVSVLGNTILATSEYALGVDEIKVVEEKDTYASDNSGPSTTA